MGDGRDHPDRDVEVEALLRAGSGARAPEPSEDDRRAMYHYLLDAGISPARLRAAVEAGARRVSDRAQDLWTSVARG